MNPNSTGYGHGQAYFPYQDQSDYIQSQPQSRPGSTQDYSQYVGIGSQQYPANQAGYPGNQSWNMSSGASMNNHNAFYQNSMLRTQSASGIEDPLATISTDFKAVENAPVEDFTTGLHADWRPPGFSGYANGKTAYHQNIFPAQSSGGHTGAMSEPTPTLPAIIDLSSDEASDSAYMTQLTEAALTYGPSSQTNGVQSHNVVDQPLRGKYQDSLPPARPHPSKHASDSRITSVKERRKTTHSVPSCEFCNYAPKNPSDAVKHHNKHTKPYKCKYDECKAKGIGFATPNDLDRHLKCGKHNQAPTMGSGKAYVCAACHVSPESNIKWWPRLDNFKAHILRRHKDHDIVHLIKISERDVRSKPPNAITEYGEGSIFHGSSIADRNDYQFQEPQSATSRTMPLPFGSQGETSLWPHDHEDSFLYSIDELAGVGEATHLANNPDPSRHEFNTSVTDGSHADGYAGLSLLSSAAAEVSGGQHLEVPRFKLHPARESSPKREVDSSWDVSGGKRTRSATSTMIIDDVLDDSDREGNVQCTVCGKVKKRKCDLRKHMKRHIRPYGCTFPRCFVRQGSRSDWKRHEEKQHCLAEAWKCTLKGNDGNPCFAHAYRVKDFRKHLSTDHGFDGTTSDKVCTAMRLGHNGYEKFWCGFCRKVLEYDLKDNRIPSEKRWTHIGDHFDKECHIDDWVCFEINKPYRDVTKEQRREQRELFNKPRRDHDDETRAMMKLNVEEVQKIGMLDSIAQETQYGEGMGAGSSFGAG